MMRPTISIVACVNMFDFGIGRNGKLLYKFKDDMKHFKELTMDKPVIMGRKTFESLPNGKLKDRLNIVLTNGNYTSNDEDVVFVHSIDDAVKTAYGSKKYDNRDIMVIGGESVYKKFLPMADYVYLTEVIGYQCMTSYFYLNEILSPDTFFPCDILRDENWKFDVTEEDVIVVYNREIEVSKVSIEELDISPKQTLFFKFVTYKNPKSPESIESLSTIQ